MQLFSTSPVVVESENRKTFPDSLFLKTLSPPPHSRVSSHSRDRVIDVLPSDTVRAK